MLTSKQQEVSLIREHSSYVCSLPGSGKTHVNGELCFNLLNHSPQIMILDATFTRNAAAEMKKRLSQKLPSEHMKRIKIATLDSCIVNMAKAYFKHLNTRFKLLVGAEYYLTILRVYNECNLFDVETIIEIIDYYLSFPEDIEYETEQHELVVNLYKQILSSKPLPTFDLRLLGRLLIDKMKSGEVAPYSFTHIIVDEVQDTGRVQYEWLKMHALLRKTVVIGIGDDDQSIYRFAGGLGYTNFTNLKSDFDARGYALDTCFRCAPNILSFAASVIKQNKYRVHKEFNAIHSGTAGKINVHQHHHLVDDLVCHFNPKSNNTAILCRTNKLLNDIELSLINENIPYQRLNGRGGILSDFNVLAYFKLLIAIVLDLNPEGLIDSLGWLRESETNLQMLDATLRSRNIKRLSQLNHCEFDEHGLSPMTSTIFRHAHAWKKLGSSTEVFKCQKEIITTIVDAMPNEFAKRKVFGAADFLNQRIKGATFEERLRRINKMIQQASDNKVEIERDKITLSTLHASKGLEWDSVWIVDASEGSIPSEMKESVIAAKNDFELHMEDERRLFYVGATRAAKELNITFEKEMGLFLAEADLTLVNHFDDKGNQITKGKESV